MTGAKPSPELLPLQQGISLDCTIDGNGMVQAFQRSTKDYIVFTEGCCNGHVLEYALK